jgi:hypothetical protein
MSWIVSSTVRPPSRIAENDVMELWTTRWIDDRCTVRAQGQDDRTVARACSPIRRRAATSSATQARKSASRSSISTSA